MLCTPFALVLLAASQQPAAAPPPRRALLFKSGQAYLERELTLAEDQTAATLRLPAGIHGTIWLGATGHQVLGGTARDLEVVEEGEVEDLMGVLRAAVGRQVTLELSDPQRITSVSGVLRRLMSDVPTIATGQPSHFLPPSAVVLEPSIGNHRIQIVPVHRIVGVLGDAPLAAETFEAPVKRPVLDVRLMPGTAPSGSRLVLSNMASGLAWAPSYVLELGDQGKARLTGKAVVVNDLEDLEETAVQLVVGYPNLRFAHVRSALLPEVDIGQLRSMLAGQQVATPMMMNQMAVGLEVTRGVAPPPPPTLDGAASEDLFLYDAGTLSLEKGERAYLPLLIEQVDFAHRFDWELPDPVDRNAYFREQPDGQAPPVWHVLKLQNRTDAPWTTAPVLIQGERGPLAQSELGYTPPGEDVRVQLTQALDIVGESVEARAGTARSQRETVQLYGRTYELVRVQGQLSLTNRSRRSAPMHVVKHLSGDVRSADPPPQVEASAQGLGQVNGTRTLTWEFELAAGASWEASYEYEVLIRR